VSKKKTRKRRIQRYNRSAATRSKGEQSNALLLVTPLAEGVVKEHSHVFQISEFRLTQAASTPQPHSREVRVYVGEPPAFLFSVDEWEARDRIRNCEVEYIRSASDRAASGWYPETTPMRRSKAAVWPHWRKWRVCR
jgi:hypothetical protein